jgi:hypothetical protein
LLYMSDTSEEEEQIIIKHEIWTWTWDSNEDKDPTAYHRLQAHVAFAFGTSTGGDVPQIML